MIRLRNNVRVFLLFGLLASICLIVPWLVPTHLVRSDSYALGFSNSAFLLAILLILIVPTWLLSGVTAPTTAATSPRSPTGPETWRIVRGLGLFGFCASTVLLLFLARNMAGYSEAEYFLLRTVLIEGGRLPYRDFEYAYGPLMLYGIAFLKWLGALPGLAEWLLVVVESVIGYLFVSYIVRSVFGPAFRAAQMIWAALLLGTCLNALMGGQNYTFFRFATAMAAICWLLDNPTAWRIAETGILAGPMFLLGWAISPEIGAAAGLSITIMTVLLSRQRLAGTIISLASMAVVIAFVPGVTTSFETIFQFSKGGNNLPAFPAVHILLFLASIFLATKQIARTKVRDRRIEWAVFVTSICMLPGAIGRCDPGHVIFYGFGFFVLAAKYFADARPDGVSSAMLSLIVGAWFFAVSLIATATLAVVPIGGAIFRNLAFNLSAPTKVWLIAKVPPAYRYQATRSLTPMNPASLETSLASAFVISPRSDMGGLKVVQMPFFVTLHNATTVDAFEELASQTAGHVVFVPEHLPEELCAPYRLDSRTLSILYLFPVELFPLRHSPEAVTSPFCSLLSRGELVDKTTIGNYSAIRLPARRD